MSCISDHTRRRVLGCYAILLGSLILVILHTWNSEHARRVPAVRPPFSLRHHITRNATGNASHEPENVRVINQAPPIVYVQQYLRETSPSCSGQVSLDARRDPWQPQRLLDAPPSCAYVYMMYGKPVAPHLNALAVSIYTLREHNNTSCGIHVMLDDTAADWTPYLPALHTLDTRMVVCRYPPIGPPLRCILKPRGPRAAYWAPTYMFFHAFSLVQYDIVVILDFDTMINKYIEPRVAAFGATGAWVAAANDANKNACRNGGVPEYLNSGVVFARPDEDIFREFMAVRQNDTRWSCVFANQDMLNHVVRVLRRGAGFHCLGNEFNCIATLAANVCEPAHSVVHYAGRAKVYHQTRAQCTPITCPWFEAYHRAGVDNIVWAQPNGTQPNGTQPNGTQPNGTQQNRT